MNKFRPNRAAGFTLVEVMIVVLIIGVLLNIAAPAFIGARETSRAKACVGNLKQIDSATQIYCIDKKLNANNYAANAPTLNTAAATGLIGATAYLRTTPTCPSGGAYATAMAITGSPNCNIPTTYSSDTNYTSSSSSVGKYYHGL